MTSEKDQAEELIENQLRKEIEKLENELSQVSN